MFASGVKGGGASGTATALDAPTEAEAREMLAHFRRLLQAAVNREPVPLGRDVVESRLTWDARDQRFRLWASREETNWILRTSRVLGRLLEEHGHHLRQCPAPEPREPAVRCGTWFVAERPRQTYCSARCQSRAATRAYRSRETSRRPRTRGRRKAR